MIYRILVVFFFLVQMTGSVKCQVLDPVKWSYSVRKEADNSFSLKFTAKLEDTWHLYSQFIAQGGPIPTSFTFEPSDDYEKAGTVRELSKVESKFDKSFSMEVKTFSKEAVFVQKIKVKTSKPFTIKGTVEYMSCNDEKCLPPKEVPFSFDLPASTVTPNEPKAKTTPPASGKDKLTPVQVKNTDTLRQASSHTKDTLKKDLGYTSATNLPSGKVQQDDIGEKKEPDSPVGFLFYAFFWGLAGVITPCVYPMIPMTVSFFMRGESRRSRGIFKGLIFGLSIVVIYSLIGLLVSLSILSANIGNILSTHWISNTVFFLLFLVFAASFLGMFEMVLPGSLVNKIDQQAEKGGIFGAFFMALTLVIVSFSCTGPIVGKILIESSKGLSIKPIAGMFGYSLAFALPFTFFALFPSLLKTLPKSGGWLNSVKVVLGFIVLAFSLTFLANIDQNYHFDLLSRDVFIGIWIVLSVLLGFYLLGKIKFAHDSEVSHLSVPRFLLVVVIFSFALYLFTGLVGSPLKSLSWILPPQENTAFLTSRNESAVSGSLLCGTPKYADFLPASRGLSEYFDYEEGLACAKERNKPVFIDFKGHSCKNCKIMEAEVWSDPRVMQRLQNDFVVIALYTDDKFQLPQNEWLTTPDGKVLKRMDQKNQYFQVSRFDTNALPLYAILDNQGTILSKTEFTSDVDAYLKFLDHGKSKFYK